MRLRDEVNKTLNRFDGLSEPAGVTHVGAVYPGAYERKLGTFITLVYYLPILTETWSFWTRK